MFKLPATDRRHGCPARPQGRTEGRPEACAGVPAAPARRRTGLPRRARAWLLAALLALVMVLGVECAAFNLPFWATVGASTDTASAINAAGPGLRRIEGGLLEVTDPTQAWLEVKADGTSDYARIDPVDGRTIAKLSEAAKDTDDDAANTDEKANADDSAAGRGHDARDALSHLVTTMHVRADVAGRHGRAVSVSTKAPRSLYVKAQGAGTVRVWFQEAAGAVLPVTAVRANVRVPFDFSVTRVALMLALVAAVVLLRPGSFLWRVRLDPADRRQRLAFAAVALPALAAAAMTAWWQARYAWPLVFHRPGGYTYDFDQYGHVADALLAGHPWLDLPVPDALASAANPYDVTTRDRLLADGVTPIYWDYAFFRGHWYSYFGVLPALLLFLPYRALTGAMLPSSAAVTLLMTLFVLFGSLLLIRLIHRIAPRCPLAAALIALTVFMLGSNMPYLFFRTNFYTVPFAASLALTALGLWLWMGADTNRTPLRAADRWSVEGAGSLSLPRLAAGAVCIAANIGCRPTFALAALLAFPLFWPQIRALLRGFAARRFPSPIRALAAPLAIVLPALLVVIPQLAYNVARFGSPLDFGDSHQMTVTDMASFRLPVANVPVMIGEYLFAPLRFAPAFPWLALTPTPMPQWGYAEPMVGGFFMLCPFALLAFMVPFLHSRLDRIAAAPATSSRTSAGTDAGDPTTVVSSPSGPVLTSLSPTGPSPADSSPASQWGLLVSMLALALALVVFDTLRGGLGWRYMADFGWLFTLAALPGLLWLMGCLGGAADSESDRAGRRNGLAARTGDGRAIGHTDGPDVPSTADAAAATGASRLRRMGTAAVRWLLLALLVVWAALTVLMCFVPGRSDQLLAGNPALYHEVAAWFTLL